MTSVGMQRMLIESAMPTFDVVINKHNVVADDPATTFHAARALDLLTVRTPLLAASMWIRALPARLFGKASPPLPRLVIGEGVGLPDWLFLGERAGREIAFGACSTLLSYECRTVTTDPKSRRRFLRYWWAIRPFFGHIMLATVNQIKSDAEAAADRRR